MAYGGRTVDEMAHSNSQIIFITEDDYERITAERTGEGQGRVRTDGCSTHGLAYRPRLTTYRRSRKKARMSSTSSSGSSRAAKCPPRGMIVKCVRL